MPNEEQEELELKAMLHGLTISQLIDVIQFIRGLDEENTDNQDN